MAAALRSAAAEASSRRPEGGAREAGLDTLSMPLLIATLPIALFALGLRAALELYRRRPLPGWAASAAVTEVLCVTLVSLMAVGVALLAGAIVTVLHSGDRPADLGAVAALVAATLFLWWRLPRPQPPSVPLTVVEGGGRPRVAGTSRRSRPAGNRRAA